MMLGNHCLLSLRYPNWTLFLVLTFSYLSVRIRHAVAAQSGTCPFPMALSLSLMALELSNLAAIPSTTRQISGSVFQVSLSSPSMLVSKDIGLDDLMVLSVSNLALFLHVHRKLLV